MADPPTPDADESDPVAAVLVEILETDRPGAAVDPAVWYARYPELRTELEQFFADQAALTEARDQAQEPPTPAFPGYTIVRELGRGGSGVVFEATELATGRAVALKALVGAYLLTPVERVRFRREIKVASILDHPAVLPVYGAGEVDGTPYYTMMLAAGGPLSKSLDRYTPDPKAAAALVARLARGVHFAHQRGILHRDLKPSNILLDAAGAGYVSDFGLVRDLADPDPLTRTRELVGTIPYMAPESTVSRGACTVAVDVYGLGCILYACLTGRPPIEGKSDADTLIRVRSDAPPPPARLNPAVPRDLDAVCRKCLEKEPGQRYPSAAELADDLDRFGRDEPVRAKPIGPVRRAGRWMKRHPLTTTLTVVAVLAGVATTAFGIWRWEQQRALQAAKAETDRHRFFAGLERVRQRRDDPYAPWSRQSLAELRELAALAPARAHLPDLRSEAAAALAAADLEPGPLLADFLAYAAHYSADGQYLAVAGWEADPVGRVELVDLGTGDRRTLRFAADLDWVAKTIDKRPDGARGIKFSPDGRWLLAGTRSGRLLRWDMQTRAVDPLVWDAHGADHSEPKHVAISRLGFTADSRIALSGTGGIIRGWTAADGRPTGFVLEGARLPHDFSPIADELIVHSDGGGGGYGTLDALNWRFIPAIGFAGTGAYCWGPAAAPMAYLPDRDSGVHLGSGNMSDRARPIDLWSDTRHPSHLTFGPGGDLLAALYQHDLRLRMWDVASGQLVAERTPDRECPHVAFAPGGRELAVSGKHGVRPFTIPNRVLDTSVVQEPNVISVACPTDHAEAIVVAQSPGHRSVLRRLPLTPVRRPAIPHEHPFGQQSLGAASDVSPDGRVFVQAGDHAIFALLDQTQRHLPTGPIEDVRFGPDGCLWLLEPNLVRRGVLDGEPPTGWANDPASELAGMVLKCVAPGRGFALVGRRDGKVFRIVPDGLETGSWTVMDSAVLGLGVSVDGTLAAAGGERGEVRLLDLATGAVTDLPDAHRSAVLAVAYGPNFLVTGSADRRVRLWTPAGEPLATLTMRGPVAKVLVSADGSSLLVHVQGERAVRRWRLDVLFREWADLGLGVPDLP